jgi:hypothetical protein
MNLTLSALLPLVGRLDSSPGFDTPRERFRRFLVEHVTDVQIARELVEDCERSVGEQHHRALQDVVVLIGRFLGFETTFGDYERPFDGIKIDGHWRSRGSLSVVLEVRTDQSSSPTVEGLSRAVIATTAAARASGDPCIGLVVAARHYMGRGRLEPMIAADAHNSANRIMSAQSLLSLAAQVSTGRVTHIEAVKLLRSGVALDLVIDLLDRSGASEQKEKPVAASAPRRRPSYWVVTFGDAETTAAELLTAVCAQQTLPVAGGTASQGMGSPGDWVCFFLPDRGIGGHAQLASMADADAVHRDEGGQRRFRLTHIELYQEPIVQALRAARPFEIPPADDLSAGPCLSPIARQDFMALTTYRDTEPASGAADIPASDWELAIGQTSRSHA